MTKTIIKGAIYFDEDIILRPHFSGEFHTVDCTEYKTKEQIKSEYSKEHYKNFTKKNSFYITYDGIKYYECEYSPYTTENFELLSDISDLEFLDEETNF